MIFVKVIIGADFVKIEESIKPFKSMDYKALVFGEEYIYKLVRDKMSRPDNRTWRERGSTAVHYHAKNIDENARFYLSGVGYVRLNSA